MPEWSNVQGTEDLICIKVHNPDVICSIWLCVSVVSSPPGGGEELPLSVRPGLRGHSLWDPEEQMRQQTVSERRPVPRSAGQLRVRMPTGVWWTAVWGESQVAHVPWHWTHTHSGAHARTFTSSCVFSLRGFLLPGSPIFVFLKSKENMRERNMQILIFQPITDEYFTLHPMKLAHISRVTVSKGGNKSHWPPLFTTSRIWLSCSRC